MGLVLRRDIGTKLTIADLDNNFEYLGMDSNDIDLYFGNETDSVDDSLYIEDGNYYPKSFVSKVYRLGITIKNYELIENHNPEFIIERYKKRKKKIVDEYPYDGPKEPKRITVNCTSKFRQTYPYDDYITSTEMEAIDPSKKYFLRPMIIPITSASDYYRIYAENYFSQKNPPKVSGCKHNFYIKSISELTLYDDTFQHGKATPLLQTGYSTCRISIRISDGFGGYIYSKPLKNFKIRMLLNSSNFSATGEINSIIDYDIK